MKRLLKKLFKKLCRKSTYIKAATLLISAIAVVAQFIKQSFFKERPAETLAFLSILIYINYSDVNEHFVLAIAMFMCLYYSYETIAGLVKMEVKNRNDQIYKELAESVEKSVSSILIKKIKLIKLKNSVNNINSINNGYLYFISLKTKASDQSFEANNVVEKNINTLLAEELSYLDSFYNSKKEIFDNSFDNDSEFTDSKLEELE